MNQQNISNQWSTKIYSLNQKISKKYIINSYNVEKALNKKSIKLQQRTSKKCYKVSKKARTFYTMTTYNLLKHHSINFSKKTKKKKKFVSPSFLFFLSCDLTLRKRNIPNKFNDLRIVFTYNALTLFRWKFFDNNYSNKTIIYK